MKDPSRESLFNRWQGLSEKCKTLGRIVENDFSLESTNLQAWFSLAWKIEQYLHVTLADTVLYLRKDAMEKSGPK